MGQQHDFYLVQSGNLVPRAALWRGFLACFQQPSLLRPANLDSSGFQHAAEDLSPNIVDLLSKTHEFGAWLPVLRNQLQVAENVDELRLSCSRHRSHQAAVNSPGNNRPERVNKVSERTIRRVRRAKRTTHVRIPTILLAIPYRSIGIPVNTMSDFVLILTRKTIRSSG